MSQESNPPELETNSSPPRRPPPPPPPPPPPKQSTAISRHQSRRSPSPEFFLDDLGDDDFAQLFTTTTNTTTITLVEPPAKATTKAANISPPSTRPPPRPPKLPQTLHLFRSLYRDNFERAIRAIKFASRRQIPQPLKPLPPPRPPPKVGADNTSKDQTAITTTTTTTDSAKKVRRYLELATELATSLRDSSVLFNQAKASFVSPRTRSLYSRYLRLKVVGVFVQTRDASQPRGPGAAGKSLAVAVEVIEGSVVGDNAEEGQQKREEEEAEMELRFSRLAIDHGYPPLPPRSRPRFHLRGCLNYCADERNPPPPSSPPEEDLQPPISSSPSPPLPSPILPEPPHHNSPTSHHHQQQQQQYPTNALFPRGTRLLLVYGRCPLAPEYFKAGVTLMRLYPHWTALHSPAGVRPCCTAYHTLVLDGFNFALEGVTS